jgi:hypothetical protein
MDIGDTEVIATREHSTMVSTWVEGVCLTKNNATEFELFVGGFVPVAEASDYLDDETGEADTPYEIDGYPVRGVYDGVVVGGEIEKDPNDGGIRFTDFETAEVKEWMASINWDDSETVQKIQKTMVNRVKWSDPYISFYHVFKEEIRFNANLDANNFLELEKKNPDDTISVANIRTEIANSVNSICEREFFYICRVPEFGGEAYLLFSIYWDADWELWKKQLGCACVGASSHLEASDYLLKKYSFENSISSYKE